MCTGIRFSDGDGNLYLARNLDWTSGYGQQVLLTPTGYAPKSPFGALGEIRHPAIGMGIVEDDTPLYFDCGNDAGVAVAGLNFPGYAQYAAEPAEGATNVAAFEFPLWVASQFESVEQVQAALSEVVIVDRPINDKYPSSLLHWIIGDSERSIVVEYTSDGMQVFEDDFNVLANQPRFEWHRENVRNYLNTGPDFPEDTVMGSAHLKPFGSGSLMRGIPGDYYSPSRFVRAAYVNGHYPEKSSEEENVSRAFHTLQQVAMVDGCAAMSSGEFEKTIYTSLFSSRENTYYWNTYEDPAVRSVAMSDHELNGTELVLL